MPLLFHLRRFYLRFVPPGMQMGQIILINLVVTGVLMLIFENGATDQKIVTPFDHFWYYVVTTTTTGYGDLFPMTSPGRLVGIWLMTIGIGLNLVATERAIANVYNRRRKKMRGELPLNDSFTSHIVFLGAWFPDVSKEVLDHLVHHFGDKAKIALGVNHDDPIAECPDSQMQMVKGDLIDESVLVGRLRIDHAAHIIVMGRTDDETMVLAMAARHYNPSGNLIAAAEVESALAKRIKLINDFDDDDKDIVLVVRGKSEEIAKEVTAPGSSKVLRDLLDTRGDGAGMTSIMVPPDLSHPVSVEKLQSWLSKRPASEKAFLMGVHNPSQDGEDGDLLADHAMPGASIFLNASMRTNSNHIPWEELLDVSVELAVQ